MGIATVITSGKGGAGKSTVAVGLGRALALRGRRVLLVDCDAGLRSLDRMTGVEEDLVFDISDVVLGRCSPAQAIYPCPWGKDGDGPGGASQARRRDDDGDEGGGLFLLPAPASGKDLISPAIMMRLVPLLKRYYDHVLLDSPAGVGTGFRSAAAPADKALVICSPDPVCVRTAGTARQLLEELGLGDRRMVINRYNTAFFDETGAYSDLDGVIDACGLRLFGLVPEDHRMAAAFLKGNPAPESTAGMMAMQRIAARLDGENVPMPGKL